MPGSVGAVIGYGTEEIGSVTAGTAGGFLESVITRSEVPPSRQTNWTGTLGPAITGALIGAVATYSSRVSADLVDMANDKYGDCACDGSK